MDSSTFPELRHRHDTALGDRGHEQRARWVVLLTATVMVAEVAMGTLSGSMALLADGWHMATHAGALGIAAFSYWFARTRSTHQAFSFGTGKVYALGGYTSALVLALGALWMAAESVHRLFQPVPIHFGEAMPAALLGLAVNLLSIRLLHPPHADTGHHDHDHHHGIEVGGMAATTPVHHDHNLRAAYLHVVADALTSVLAIIALLAAHLLRWNWLDPVTGIVGAALVLRWGWRLSRDAARQLLDVCPSEEDATALRQRLEAIDDVRVADLHLWDMGPGSRSLMVTLLTAEPRDTSYYRQIILQHVDVAHLTVEVHRCGVAVEVPAPTA